jgi:hypothetical protein
MLQLVARLVTNVLETHAVDNIVFLNNLPKTFSKTVHTTRVIPREPVKNTRDVVAVVLHFDDDEMSRLL